MAVLVLGIAAAGVLLPFTSGAAIRAEGTHRTLAAKLASDLMEEIVAADVTSIVSNFNYTEPAGNVTDANGVIFTDPGYARYSRTVSCEDVFVDQESGTEQPKFILATVQVYYNGQEIAVINRLISRI